MSIDWSVVAAILALLLVFGGLAIRVVALGVIPGNRKPSTGMAWLLLVLLSPGLGVLAFFFFGSNKLERRRHERQQRANDLIVDRVAALPAVPIPDGLPDIVPGLVHLNQQLGSLPLSLDNTVQLLPDYRGSINAMAEAIRGAESSVDVEFYISAWDDVTAPVFEAMADAASRGVRVRFLFDHLGSRGIPGYQDFLKRLAGTDIAWHPMLPVRPLQGRFRRPDLRNHRKLAVIDGRVGFTGSQNLTEPGYNKPKNHAVGREWVELMARVTGPVVTSLAAVFAQDWYAETDEVSSVLPAETPATTPQGALTAVACQVVPSGPGYVWESNLRMFNTLLYGARRRLSITSPYFVPDESLLYSVTTAARRGVAVELFVSEVSDQFMVGHAQASYYRALLEAGVRIYLYPAPWILHGKHFTVDDHIAVIGSSNMDQRSFALNFEVSMMMLGADVVTAMREVEDGYRAASRELTSEEWSQRPMRKKYVDNVMRLTAGLQ
ncbi:cardiolipin synthase [Nocardioides sp.]|uniref:cardiolipin synthase n=1 Tax=Nocardioides sp. TaxID=35761 RepID=UPI0035281968